MLQSMGLQRAGHELTDSVVKKPPCNAGNVGSIPAQATRPTLHN